MTDPKKTIGALNGPWAWGLKIMLATYPILFGGMIGWLSWITVGQIKDDQFRAAGERFSREDYREHVRQQEAEFRRLDARVDALPPADWRASRLKLEGDVSALQKLAAENRNILIRIETKLETLK